MPVTSLTREFVRQRQHIVVLNSVLGEGLRVFQGRIVLEQPLLFRHLVRDVAWRQLEILRARVRVRESDGKAREVERAPSYLVDELL